MNMARKKLIKEALAFGFRAALGIIFISPLILGVLFSLQSELELGTYPLKLFTDHPTLQNYQQVFQIRMQNVRQQYVNVISRHQVVQKDRKGKAYSAKRSLINYTSVSIP